MTVQSPADIRSHIYEGWAKQALEEIKTIDFAQSKALELTRRCKSFVELMVASGIDITTMEEAEDTFFEFANDTNSKGFGTSSEFALWIDDGEIELTSSFYEPNGRTSFLLAEVEIEEAIDAYVLGELDDDDLNRQIVDGLRESIENNLRWITCPTSSIDLHCHIPVTDLDPITLMEMGYETFRSVTNYGTPSSTWVTEFLVQLWMQEEPEDELDEILKFVTKEKVDLDLDYLLYRWDSILKVAPNHIWNNSGIDNLLQSIESDLLPDHLLAELNQARRSDHDDEIPKFGFTKFRPTRSNKETVIGITSRYEFVKTGYEVVSMAPWTRCKIPALLVGRCHVLSDATDIYTVDKLVQATLRPKESWYVFSALDNHQFNTEHHTPQSTFTDLSTLTALLAAGGLDKKTLHVVTTRADLTVEHLMPHWKELIGLLIDLCEDLERAEIARHDLEDFFSRAKIILAEEEITLPDMSANLPF